VKPDVAVPAASALQTAYTSALKDLVARTTDAEKRDALQRAQASLEKGEVELPPYLPRRIGP
jgi:hypothetical protein